MSTSKIVLKVVSISFSILVLLMLVWGITKMGSFAYDFGYRVFTEEPVSKEPGKDVTIRIDSSMTAQDIGDMLQEKGLVRSGTLFVAQLKLSAYNDKLKDGSYTLNTSMDAKEMMQIMSGSELDTETLE